MTGYNFFHRLYYLASNPSILIAPCGVPFCWLRESSGLPISLGLIMSIATDKLSDLDLRRSRTTSLTLDKNGPEIQEIVRLAEAVAA